MINRSLYAAGQGPLKDEDISGKNSMYELCKSFYLQTFLEALSEVDWTGGRKRDRLVKTGRPVLEDRRFRFAYDLPYDCAKPVELQDNEFFQVEDKILYTDVDRAELLYVSNGRIPPEMAAVSMGKPGDLMELEYLTAGRPDTEPDFVLYPGEVSDILDEPPEDPEPVGDYPEYRLLDYEPKFHEYIEKALAAKFAMKLSDQPGLHTMLLQEAMIIKQEAYDASRSRSAAKLNGAAWWTEGRGR
jgi:hypothetical protein